MDYEEVKERQEGATLGDAVCRVESFAHMGVVLIFKCSVFIHDFDHSYQVEVYAHLTHNHSHKIPIYARMLFAGRRKGSYR